MRKALLIFTLLILIVSLLFPSISFAKDELKDNYKLIKEDGKVKWKGNLETIDEIVGYKTETEIIQGTIYNEYTGITSPYYEEKVIQVPVKERKSKYKWNNNGKLFNEKEYNKALADYPMQEAEAYKQLAQGLITINDMPSIPKIDSYIGKQIEVITGESLKSAEQVKWKNTAIEQEVLDKFGAKDCDYIWLEGVNEPGTVILPDVYDKVFIATGTYDNPKLTEIGTEKIAPYYEVKGGKTYVYVNHFSGAGGLWVGVTCVFWVQPIDIIESLTTTTARLYDRTANITSTIVWGGVPSGITTETGALVSDYSSTYINPNATQDIAPIITPPVITSDTVKETAISTDPFITGAETVELITNNRLPVLLQYWWAYIVIGILLFIFIYAYFPNLILAGIGFCLPIGYGISQGIFDFWVIIALALWLLGCVITEGRRLFA